MTKSKHIVDLILIFFLFVIMRIWLAWFSGNPVGVDAWDYMSWIKKSYSSQSLMHAPLHVPGFYAFISMIAIYTGIDIFVLYTYLLPFLGAIIFWLSLQPLFKTHKLYALGGCLERPSLYMGSCLESIDTTPSSCFRDHVASKDLQ